MFYLPQIFCGTSNIQLTPTTRVNITSPLFPNQYPLTIDCIWILTTSAKGTIVLKFLTFEVDLSHDFLYIAPTNTTVLLDVDAILVTPFVMEFTGLQAPKSVLIQHSDI